MAEIKDFESITTTESIVTLEKLGEEIIMQKAKDVAKQIEIYIKSHPNKTVKELQEDTYFRSIAVQPVGKTGYTAITDYDNLICRFHVSPKIENTNLHLLSDKMPDFWNIMSATKGGVDAKGYYDWDDPLYNKTRKKYMYIASIDPNVKTADGVGFHVAATTYIDEFSFPMDIVGEKISQASKTFIEAANKKINYSKNIIFVVFIIFTLIFISILFYTERKITKPLIKLHQTAQQFEKGNFDARAEVKTGDELEQLGSTLNKTAIILKQRDDEQKQLDRAKTEFLSITSHELRSPMTPMQAQLQMLLGEYFGKLNPKQKESLDIVLRNTTRLDNIIQDFLEISRIEAARLKFKFIKTNLAEHTNRLIEEMNGFMPEKKIRIISKIGRLPTIEVDPDRVMQVLRNLLDNAKKFSPPNTELFVNVELKNNMIEFTVKDHGIGISPENQRKIFEPFFQAEQTMYREKGGTGLGLAICQGIIQSQNGRLWLESKPGQGTTFYFTVPLKPVRKSKPIKLLFSPQQDIEKKIKNLFINYLGPLGEQEFDILEKQGLKYEFIMEYIKGISKKEIISDLTAEQLTQEITTLFGIKKTINIPYEIKKKYLEILGPSGEKRFQKLSSLNSNNIILGINNLEKKGILNALEASRFRDFIMGLFRQKEVKK